MADPNNALGTYGVSALTIMTFTAERNREAGFVHVLLVTTGSVASIKAPLIVKELLGYQNVKIEVVATKPSLAFYSKSDIFEAGPRVWTDEDEWTLTQSTQTSLMRALSPTTPTYIFPAMNTLMYEHPLTAEHLRIVHDVVGYNIIGPIGKSLACGDVGTSVPL
ncbi:hypothetical protein H0H87_006825 [Tephrocybe sp. NHM501043]|nr:hypothetical protein H0H87_006825 [Tephrocybe sp. NHM501043]